MEPKKWKKSDAWGWQFHACADTPPLNRLTLILACWWGPRRNQPCEFFFENRPKGFGASRPEIWHFPLTLLVVLATLSHYRVSMWSGLQRRARCGCSRCACVTHCTSPSMVAILYWPTQMTLYCWLHPEQHCSATDLISCKLQLVTLTCVATARKLSVWFSAQNVGLKLLHTSFLISPSITSNSV